MNENKGIAVVAKANEPTSDGLVYTREALQKIANDFPGRYNFDEETNTLYMMMDLKTNSSQILTNDRLLL